MDKSQRFPISIIIPNLGIPYYSCKSFTSGKLYKSPLMSGSACRAINFIRNFGQFIEHAHDRCFIKSLDLWIICYNWICVAWSIPVVALEESYGFLNKRF